MLRDSSGNGFSALRSAGTSCGVGPGDDGTSARDAIAFRAAGDVVSIPNRPEFELSQNLTVSAWVRPASVTQDQVIVQKAGSGSQSFTLGIRNRRVEFTIALRNGRTATSSAPISADRWTHVAGLFDGTFLFLFVDGRRVGQVSSAGLIRNVNAPIRIGSATGGTRSFRGRIDEVRFSAQPLTEFDIPQSACLSRPAELVSVVPPTSGLVEPDTRVDYAIGVQDRNFGAACFETGLSLQIDNVPPGFTVDTSQSFTSIAAGTLGFVSVGVIGTSDADPGLHELPFTVFASSPNRFDELRGQLGYELAVPEGCFIRTSRELMIKHLSVVDDPVRTTFDNAGNPASGVWTFGALMRNLAPTPEQAPAMVEAMFRTWLTPQTVNGFTIPARTAIQEVVFDQWPRTPAGQLDLTRSPLTLQAIVNRVDLRNLSAGNAGEGRFVFAVNSRFGGAGFSEQFTIILEYRLPATTESAVLEWANDWHALGNLPFPSEEYNVALQAITDRFTGRNAEPGRPNGSALGQLRTNEIALVPRWELREFALTSAGLIPAPVQLTPANEFDQTSTLADFINANEAAIVIERHTVPALFAGQRFLGGSSFNDLVPWTAAGINNNEARHKFSINTCNGCHGPEAGTTFLQIDPRSPGQEARLAPFLIGVTVNDPVSGEPRTLNDLARRREDLEFLVCPKPVTARTAAPAPGQTSIARGIQRVH